MGLQDRQWYQEAQREKEHNLGAGSGRDKPQEKDDSAPHKRAEYSPKEFRADTQKNRYRHVHYSPRNLPRPEASFGLVGILFGLAALGVLGTAIYAFSTEGPTQSNIRRAVAEYYPDRWKPLPAEFPSSGTVLRYQAFHANKAHGRFIINGAGLSHSTRYQVQVNDSRTKRPVISAFLAGGATIDTILPRGEYSISISTGPVWYGQKDGFWWSGRTFFSPYSLSIEQSADGRVHGRQLNLLSWLRAARAG